MNICFPVQNNAGLTSRVFNHFGSAPMFIIVNTDTGDLRAITNNDLHHTHGSCNPLKAIGGSNTNVVVVGGIGAGALNRLKQMGITVYRSGADTIEENIDLLAAKQLAEYSAMSCCGGLSHGSSCAH